MSRVFREQAVTVIELGSSYESLDQAALLEFGGILLAEAEHAQPPLLVLDLDQTGYIGSSFLELLVRAWKRLRARNGAMALCGVKPFCAEVLETTRLDHLWPIHRTRSEAIAGLTGPLETQS